MCGLAGWLMSDHAVRSRKHTIRALAVALLARNDQRGGHAWGYYLPRGGEVAKGLGDATKMGKGRFDRMVAEPVVIAHTRWATTGAKEVVENAHPFVTETIVGAHNGVVSNHWEMNKKYGRECKVDSEHIFRHLDEGRDLHELQAYGAVTFSEKTGDPETVFLARFNGGVLALAEVPGYGWVWSSDKADLEACLGLAGVRPADVSCLKLETLFELTLTGGPKEVGEFDVGSPHYDPDGYRRQYQGYYGGSSSGGFSSYVHTGAAKDPDGNDDDSTALAVVGDDTQLEVDDIDPTLGVEFQGLGGQVDDVERERRRDYIEDLLLEIESELEWAAESGYQPWEVQAMLDGLKEKAKAEYDEWLQDRLDRRAAFAAHEAFERDAEDDDATIDALRH